MEALVDNGGPNGTRKAGWSRRALALGFLCILVAPVAVASKSALAEIHGQPDTVEFGLTLMDQTEAAHAWQAKLLASYAAVEVSGAVARAKIRQVFINDDSALVDARYLFPLPDDAAVDKLTVRFGDTSIEGILKEKVEARQTFERARAAGRRAGLVEALRPNIFSTDLANVQSGELVSVDLEYQITVKPKDGVFEMRIPQTITPRFMPQQHLASMEVPNWETLMDALSENGAVMETNNPNSPHGFPAAFAIKLKAGGEIAYIESPSHELVVRHGDSSDAEVALKDRFVPADRDFVLRWKLAEATSPKAMLFHEEWDGAHYYMAMVAPSIGELSEAPPRDLKIIVDTSGSMHGPALEQAKAALLVALNGLRPEDRFDIIQFNTDMHQLFGASVPVTDTSVELAQSYVRALISDGGTNMAPALMAALPGPAAPPSDRFRHVVFLTDGAVSNENALFSLTRTNLGAARLFTVGLGPAPNSWFMRKAAQAGRGTFLNIDRVDESEEKIAALYRRLESVQMTDLQITAQAAGLSSIPDVEIFPRALPDLYAGEPLYFVLRTVEEADRLDLRGQFGGKAWSRTLETNQAVSAPGLAKLWAREKLEELDDMRRLGADPVSIKNQALPLALAHGIAGRYTSFVAVETDTGPRPEPTRNVDSPERNEAIQTAAFKISGPATAVGWKEDFLIAVAAALTTLLLAWVAFRPRRPVL